MKNFSFQIAAAPNYYFNNLEIFQANVKPINYSAYSRIMWNTRYRLSFGVEAGYIRLYRVGDFVNAPDANITMTAVPIHAAIKMKMTDEIYAVGTFGPSLIINSIQSNFGEQTTHTSSIADLSLAIGYKYLLENNFYFGAELKYYYSSKAEDRNISLPVFIGLYF